MSEIVKEEAPMEEDEEEEDEETADFGPDFNPEYFEFLIKNNADQFIEGDFTLNRPFKASINILVNPHGSVKLFQGETCALCAVYGPTEVRMTKELPHRAAVDVLFRPKITGTSQIMQATGWDASTEERAIEAKLTGILESVLFLEDDMGAGFNVIFHELENDGCLFASCVNAAALALLNAGCSMRCTFGAVTILINERDNKLIVDPSKSQMEDWDAMLTFVFTNDGKVLYTGLEGKCSGKLMNLCMRQAMKASEEIFSFQRLVQFKESSTFLGKYKNEECNVKEKEEEDIKIKMEDVKLDDENDDDDEYEDLSDSDDGEILSSE